MSLSRRLRNIAKTQLNNIKERLDRIDEEADSDFLEKRSEQDAKRELNDPTDIRPQRRSPEEIAATGSRPRQSISAPAQSSAPAPLFQNPLAVHYRVLDLEVGSDLSAVEAAYSKLCQRNLTDKFPEGSEERKAAEQIFKRVDTAYNTLRDALDATAGRFDKLEL